MEFSERSPTSITLAALCLVLPLLIFPPSFSFSFDSLPKAVFLYACAATFLVAPGALARCIINLWSTRTGKYLLVLSAIESISLLVSTSYSVDPGLSLFGTRWRYFGAFSQVAVLAMAVAAAGCFRVCPAALFLSLRMFSLGGLLAAVYALSQFFGFDPILNTGLYTLASAMHVTRPPSSLGHPGYLAGYETVVLFVALALLQRERRRLWRLMLFACVGFALLSIFISGTRAAVLAVALSFPVFYAIRDWRVLSGRTTRILLASSVVVFVLLVFLPQGRGLRQRFLQSAGDPGGPRLLVWKDTIPLIGARAMAGNGPETFTVVFPKYESRELYQRYPDFQQESPHNVFLDAAVAQGIPGLLELLFAVGLSGLCVWKADKANRDIANILFAGVVACIVFHQFFVFTLPTYWAFVLTVSALVSFSKPLGGRQPEWGSIGRMAATTSGALLAIVFLAGVAQLSITDYGFARIDSDLKDGDIAGAVERYRSVRYRKLFGHSPDLWYSQQMAWVAQVLPPGELQQRAQSEALESSRVALEDPGEDSVPAAYHRAILSASTGQQELAEKIARQMSAEAPNWYQSHWILSRLLAISGRLQEGKREAELALSLIGDTKPTLRKQIDTYHQSLLLFEKNSRMSGSRSWPFASSE